MLTQRSSGILMHPTSLPSHGGIGDLGPAAYEFVNWLAAARQTLWQILPLGPVGYGNSPYSCTSAFAGNVLMISLERLADRGYLDPARVARSSRRRVARLISRRFARRSSRCCAKRRGTSCSSPSPVPRERYDAFCAANQWWLEDYALFSVLREHFGDHPWNSWPEEIAPPRPGSTAAVAYRPEGPAGGGALPAVRLLRAVEGVASLLRRARHPNHRRRCHLRQLRQRRCLDPSRHLSLERGPLAGSRRRRVRPTPSAKPVSAGAIRFTTGMLSSRAATTGGSSACAGRSKPATSFDSITSAASRPAGKFPPTNRPRSTVIGHPAPTTIFSRPCKSALGALPFIAEDLGYITPEVRDLRKKLDIPGMKVMQFGFGDNGAHIYLPHMFTPDSVVYTGTHDNDTTVGWWDSSAKRKRKTLGVRVSWQRRRRNSLGIYPGRLHFGGNSGSHSGAGCPGTGQRCAHEYSQQAGRKLVVAPPPRCSDAGVGPEAGLASPK